MVRSNAPSKFATKERLRAKPSSRPIDHSIDAKHYDIDVTIISLSGILSESPNKAKRREVNPNSHHLNDIRAFIAFSIDGRELDLTVIHHDENNTTVPLIPSDPVTSVASDFSFDRKFAEALSNSLMAKWGTASNPCITRFSTVFHRTESIEAQNCLNYMSVVPASVLSPKRVEILIGLMNLYEKIIIGTTHFILNEKEVDVMLSLPIHEHFPQYNIESNKSKNTSFSPFKRKGKKTPPSFRNESRKFNIAEGATLFLRLKTSFNMTEAEKRYQALFIKDTKELKEAAVEQRIDQSEKHEEVYEEERCRSDDSLPVVNDILVQDDASSLTELPQLGKNVLLEAMNLAVLNHCMCSPQAISFPRAGMAPVKETTDDTDANNLPFFACTEHATKEMEINPPDFTKVHHHIDEAKSTDACETSPQRKDDISCTKSSSPQGQIHADCVTEVDFNEKIMNNAIDNDILDKDEDSIFMNGYVSHHETEGYLNKLNSEQTSFDNTVTPPIDSCNIFSFIDSISNSLRDICTSTNGPFSCDSGVTKVEEATLSPRINIDVVLSTPDAKSIPNSAFPTYLNSVESLENETSEDDSIPQKVIARLVEGTEQSQISTLDEETNSDSNNELSDGEDTYDSVEAAKETLRLYASRVGKNIIDVVLDDVSKRSYSRIHMSSSRRTKGFSKSEAMKRSVHNEEDKVSEHFDARGSDESSSMSSCFEDTSSDEEEQDIKFDKSDGPRSVVFM